MREQVDVGPIIHVLMGAILGAVFYIGVEIITVLLQILERMPK